MSESDGGAISCEAEYSTAGLVLGARVQKIDDNGFVSFSLSPQISATTGETFENGAFCPETEILNFRRLDTGSVRVRDGQTLILTGVISESDRQVVSKWPVLGDIPLVGQFFRASTGDRQRNELVIMVTPRVINDDVGGTYGYGYRPATAPARELIYNQSQRRP
ncbi:type II secretion system protein GspD [Synechococcus sp. RSCCF101]|uniref:type II secretion system protein GspD n=1 Tax=Synechococcus sp. RSCCF101 TaxID=2511069 RepID=UPI0021026ED2|nr:type II and III secretion system protein [Synechococcus sp. RSCCF101]